MEIINPGRRRAWLHKLKINFFVGLSCYVLGFVSIYLFTWYHYPEIHANYGFADIINSSLIKYSSAYIFICLIGLVVIASLYLFGGYFKLKKLTAAHIELKAKKNGLQNSYEAANEALKAKKAEWELARKEFDQKKAELETELKEERERRKKELDQKKTLFEEEKERYQKKFDQKKAELETELKEEKERHKKELEKKAGLDLKTELKEANAEIQELRKKLSDEKKYFNAIVKEMEEEQKRLRENVKSLTEKNRNLTTENYNLKKKKG